MQSYKDLLVWKKSMAVVELVYHVSQKFPSDERFGLVSQMRRAAVSVPSNIAEGRKRSTRRDFRQFIILAYGSASELETQLEIALRLRFISDPDYFIVSKNLVSVLKMLNRLISALS